MNLLDGFSIALLLMFVGSLLVLLEVFFPSGGILGSFAALSFLAAIYYAYESGGVSRGLWFAAAELVITPVVILLAFKYLPHTPMGRVLLGEAPTAEEVAPEDNRRGLTGRVGVARTKMLPAGSIEIDGQVLDAVSQGQAIDRGDHVRVVEVRGNRVVVRRASAGERPADGRADDLLARPAEELGLEGLGFDDPPGGESRS